MHILDDVIALPSLPFLNNHNIFITLRPGQVKVFTNNVLKIKKNSQKKKLNYTLYHKNILTFTFLCSFNILFSILGVCFLGKLSLHLNWIIFEYVWRRFFFVAQCFIIFSMLGCLPAIALAVCHILWCIVIYFYALLLLLMTLHSLSLSSLFSFKFLCLWRPENVFFFLLLFFIGNILLQTKWERQEKKITISLENIAAFLSHFNKMQLKIVFGLTVQSSEEFLWKCWQNKLIRVHWMGKQSTVCSWKPITIMP